MKLTINGKDYTFEFTIAASLCETCVEKTTKLIFGIVDAKSDEDLNKMIQSITDIYSTTFALFYGGLLEHHSNEIRSEKDAKELLAAYFRENTDRKEYNYYTLFNQLLEQVKEDGFFDLLGLDSMMESLTAEEEPKQTTAKKKATKN